jgi:hypothetical protein
VRTYTQAVQWFAAVQRAGGPRMLGGGQEAGCAGVGRLAAGPVQRGLCQ